MRQTAHHAGGLMRQTAHHAGFARTIAAGVRQREIQRQLRYNRVRKATTRHRNLLKRKVPPLLEDFAGTIAAALIGCWVIGLLAHTVAGIDPLYTFAALGLFYSTQATYHKYRLAIDPSYKVPRCRCAGRREDNTETVLQSQASLIGRIPNSMLGTVVYSTAIALWALGHTAAIVPLAGGAVLASVYLSYVMVFRIRALCSTCISLCALNILILLNVAL
jgi:uncharacterized membrane protein